MYTSVENKLTSTLKQHLVLVRHMCWYFYNSIKNIADQCEGYSGEVNILMKSILGTYGQQP